MTTQMHDTGEEAAIKDFWTNSADSQFDKPTTVDVSLYHDGEVSGDTTAGDNLADSDDLGAITTEPDTATAYARQTVGIDGNTTVDVTSTDNASGNWQVNIPDQTFDTSGITTAHTVDAYFIIMNFSSEDAGETTKTSSNHLLYTGNLDQAYDLANIDSFTLSGAGLNLS